MNDLPVRKNIRLKDYDYSQNGVYFITICIENRECGLSIIRRGDPCGRPEMTLTQLGEICKKTFNTIENTYIIKIDKYVIMPDHIHFIIFQTGDREGRHYGNGSIVGGYKSLVANEWLKICKSNNIFMGKLWQSNYHDHIIRDEEDYKTKWQYIDENPAKWADDEHY